MKPNVCISLRQNKRAQPSNCTTAKLKWMQNGGLGLMEPPAVPREKKKIDEKYVLFYATAIWTAPKIITFKIHAAHMQMVNKVWLGRQMKMILGKSMLQR